MGQRNLFNKITKLYLNISLQEFNNVIDWEIFCEIVEERRYLFMIL